MTDGTNAIGMTMAEKILARASGRTKVKVGEYVVADIDLVMLNDAAINVFRILERANVEKIYDLSRVVVCLDHYVPPTTIRQAEGYRLVRQAVRKFNIKDFYDINTGVAHQVLIEKGYVVPGELVLGSDSHSTIYGALGAAGTGIGFTEMAYVLATGQLWFRVPPTVEFVIQGDFPAMVTSKDMILHIAGKFGTEIAQYKAVEFRGRAVHAMSLGSRMAVSNMGVEIGAKFAFFHGDDRVAEFLAPLTQKPFSFCLPDPDASYEQRTPVDISRLEPQVAMPHDVGNVSSISDIDNIPIDQAFLGSCSNGRMEDLEMAASILAGKKVSPNTRLLVTPCSRQVLLQALAKGVLTTLVNAGAIICSPGCGTCFGGHCGLLAAGERCISSSSRNFRGRMGSPEAEIYLASPYTVAASAVAGRIMDPRHMK